jgi:hypothetical protein
MVSEAVGAVNRFVGSGLEGHLSILAAIGTDRRIHLPFPAATITSALATRNLALAAAIGATNWLVREALLRVERLLSLCENESASTVTAC